MVNLVVHEVTDRLEKVQGERSLYVCVKIKSTWHYCKSSILTWDMITWEPYLMFFWLCIIV